MADELASLDTLQSSQQTPVSQYLFQGLMARGFNAPQAAALVGNMKQESEWNPAAPNPQEGALGLIQWRLERKQNLFNFAQATGRSPTSLDTQMDFVVHEMKTSEAQSAAPFLASKDVNSANAALHGYIRYGDNTEPTRLAYAHQIAGGNFSGGPVKAASHGGYGQTGDYGGIAALATPPERQPPSFLDTVSNAVTDTAEKKAEAAPAVPAAAEQKPALGQGGVFGLAPQQPPPTQAPRTMDYYLALLKQSPTGAVNG